MLKKKKEESTVNIRLAMHSVSKQDSLPISNFLLSYPACIIITDFIFWCEGSRLGLDLSVFLAQAFSPGKLPRYVILTLCLFVS